MPATILEAASLLEEAQEAIDAIGEVLQADAINATLEGGEGLSLRALAGIGTALAAIAAELSRTA